MKHKSQQATENTTQMKIDPGFTSHWKTKLLVGRCGPEAALGLLRLWGNAQVRREWKGLALTPKKLAAVMEYGGDAEALWAAMTDPDAPWLDAEDGGTWAIHGFAEHQKQVIALWENGKSGGRPKLPLNNPPPLKNTYSYPISEPFGNLMVSAPYSTEETAPKASFSLPLDSEKKVVAPDNAQSNPAPQVELPFGPRFREAWGEWQQHRKELKKKLTPTAIKRQLKACGGFTEEECIDAIGRAMMAGWQAFFPRKADNGQRPVPQGKVLTLPSQAQGSSSFARELEELRAAAGGWQ